MAGFKNGIYVFTNRTATTAGFGNETVRADVAKDLGRGVGRCRAEASDFHRRQVVHIVSHAADFREVDLGDTGKFSQRCGFISAALEDILDMHFGCIPVYQRAVFTGGERKHEPGAACKGNAHNIGEAKPLPFLAPGTPPHSTIGQDPVHVKGNSPNSLQSGFARRVGCHSLLNRRTHAPEFLNDWNLTLEDALDPIAL